MSVQVLFQVGIACQNVLLIWFYISPIASNPALKDISSIMLNVLYAQHNAFCAKPKTFVRHALLAII